jgi:hypothetical protein
VIDYRLPAVIVILAFAAEGTQFACMAAVEGLWQAMAAMQAIGTGPP